eukprot:symbB.v1.2.015825.t1/scaffold1191.1/size132917/4
MLMLAARSVMDSRKLRLLSVTVGKACLSCHLLLDGRCVLSPWASFWEDAAGDLRKTPPPPPLERVLRGAGCVYSPLGPFEGCPNAGEAAIC